MAPGERSVERRRWDGHRDDHRHEWTTFEFDIMLSLICKGTHHHGIVEFATRFNEGLNGPGFSGHGRDIEMEDIQEILVYVLDKKKAAIAFIERQHMPRITRAQKRVFMRNIDFTGTMKEWKADGRKDVEALEHPERVRRMVERKQKEEFLRDFERHVEEQGMQRGHDRLAGGLEEASQDKATLDGSHGPRVSDDFRFISRDSPAMPGAVNPHRGLDASANMPGPRAPTYPSAIATQHHESTSVVPVSTRVASRPPEVSGHVQGNNIHETQPSLSTNTEMPDISHTLPTTVNPLFDATYPRAHARDLLRPVREQGQDGLPPYASSLPQNANPWHGDALEYRPATSPDGQPASQRLSVGSGGRRQPCFEASGRQHPMTGMGPVSGIGSEGASMSPGYDRQSTLEILPRNVENGLATQPSLATQFADLQAQLSNQEGTYRNDSRKLEDVPTRDSRNRAPR